MCDGTAKRKATILQWFNGRRDGRRPLRLRAGGHALQITSRRAGGVIRGRLNSHAFELRPVSGSAGTFERTVPPLEGSWISLDGKRIRGVFVDPRPRRCIIVTTSAGPAIVCR